jgi:hypothetical protein
MGEKQKGCGESRPRNTSSRRQTSEPTVNAVAPLENELRHIDLEIMLGLGTLLILRPWELPRGIVAGFAWRCCAWSDAAVKDYSQLRLRSLSFSASSPYQSFRRRDVMKPVRVFCSGGRAQRLHPGGQSKGLLTGF